VGKQEFAAIQLHPDSFHGEDIRKLSSKLEDDLLRIHRILERATKCGRRWFFRPGSFRHCEEDVCDCNPEDSLRLTSAFEALIESIESCAKVLAVNASEHARQTPGIGIACNLILQSIDRIYEYLKRLNSDTADPAGHGRPATVREIESEIARIIRRHLDCSRNEKGGLSPLPASQQTLESIQTTADRCRDLARLLEEIYAGLTLEKHYV